MSKKTIIRNCDKCGKEDTINCISGLCPSCEKESIKTFDILTAKNKKERDFLRSCFKK
jgi:NMD protein affecting ribosome stability and mRNA decay